jgi:hypothetical protein
VSEKRSAIRFWERRRISYNVVLAVATAFGYFPRAGVCAATGDAPQFGDGILLLILAAYAVGANLCYTLAYALEFFFGSDDASQWARNYRRPTFVLGTLFSAVLAFLAAGGLALAQFPD